MRRSFDQMKKENDQAYQEFKDKYSPENEEDN
jgi:hypothetical protein